MTFPGTLLSDFLAGILIGEFLQGPVTMLKLLQAVRPNLLYTPGGVDNFWKVEGDDDERKAANTEEFGVSRNGMEGDLSIDSRKEEGMKGFERTGGEKGWSATWRNDKAGWRNDTATFQPVFKRNF